MPPTTLNSEEPLYVINTSCVSIVRGGLSSIILSNRLMMLLLRKTQVYTI